jgi:hypothetical protein
MPNAERTTPENITSLGYHEIFVFGSNLAGRHGKGAALTARKFGAVNGRGVGHVGWTYAIPTKDENIKTLPLSEIRHYASRFIAYAEQNGDLTFLVTEIGCGLAGYKPEQIAPVFRDAPNNVVLPASFLKPR